MRQNMNGLLLQCWQQGLVVKAVLLIHQLRGFLVIGFEGLTGVSTAFVFLGMSGQMQHGPDFKKLIQIGGNNTQVPQTLQQWHFSAFGPIQDARVEVQDAGITVQKRALRSDSDRVCGQVGSWRRCHRRFVFEVQLLNGQLSHSNLMTLI